MISPMSDRSVLIVGPILITLSQLAYYLSRWVGWLSAFVLPLAIVALFILAGALRRSTKQK